MPLRQDNSLWFNLPGVVAAYQPVRAPDPMLARYNQAYGGDNRYKAVDGVAPTWAGHTGWTFDGATQFVNTRVDPTKYYSYIVRYINGAASGISKAIFGVQGFSNKKIILTVWNSSSWTWNNNGLSIPGINGVGSSYVLGLVANDIYINGVYYGSTATTNDPMGVGGTGFTIFIGGLSFAGGLNSAKDCSVQGFVTYSRALSATEVWTASRQMRYCDVNPDWSAWGRRRQWYYAPSVGAGAVAIRPNVGVLGLGNVPSIQPGGRL